MQLPSTDTGCPSRYASTALPGRVSVAVQSSVRRSQVLIVQSPGEEEIRMLPAEMCSAETKAAWPRRVRVGMRGWVHALLMVRQLEWEMEGEVKAPLPSLEGLVQIDRVVRRASDDEVLAQAHGLDGFLVRAFLLLEDFARRDVPDNKGTAAVSAYEDVYRIVRVELETADFAASFL